jgi:hypothetical protein
MKKKGSDGKTRNYLKERKDLSALIETKKKELTADTKGFISRMEFRVIKRRFKEGK